MGTTAAISISSAVSFTRLPFVVVVLLLAIYLALEPGNSVDRVRSKLPHSSGRGDRDRLSVGRLPVGVGRHRGSQLLTWRESRLD